MISMDNAVIRVENLSKQYRLGQFVGYQTLRESLVNVFSSPFRYLHSAITRQNGESANGDVNRIWALKDISFEVKRGEAIGLIGRNGAGKTTLLKILSRITEPTEGYAQIRGRVGSLLEVGTGFHPELTGRENIYLNGAILGMKKKEIDRKYDEIVEFSGVGKFIDTPLKRFSSGMQVRLAFSVAAHLEPEILLVDEVLAVGDLDFQKKCMGKMEEVAGGGRTVLFVSHNMGNINNLCPKTILLEQGRVAMIGESHEVISKYIGMGADTSGEVTWDDLEPAPDNDNVRLKAVRIRSKNNVTRDILINEDIQIEIDYWNQNEKDILTTILILKDKMGSDVLASNNSPSANLSVDNWSRERHPKGLFRSICAIPANFLNNDKYSIDVGISNGRGWEAFKENAISFVVHETGEQKKEYSVNWRGVVRPRLAWSTKFLGHNSSKYHRNA